MNGGSMRTPLPRTLSLLAGLSGCSLSPTANGAFVSGMVRFDVRDIPGFGVGVTEAETVAIVVKPSKGDSVARRFSIAGASTLNEPFKIPKGYTRFEATIISNSGVLLYRGADSGDVSKDSYSVTIIPTAMRPVLAVYPAHKDTVYRGALTADTFKVINRGLGSLTWSTSNPATTCPACFTITPSSGTATAAGTLGFPTVRAGTTLSTGSYNLTITSTVAGQPPGSVVVRVTVR